MNIDSKLAKLDIDSWAGFMLFATSIIIIAVTLLKISRIFSTNLAVAVGD